MPHNSKDKWRAWYEARKKTEKGQAWRERNMKAQNNARTRKRAWLKQYRKERGCASCGMNDERCLDLHHPNPKEKERSIESLASGGWSLERLKEEADKCIVLCANCHRIEHAERE